MACGGDVSDPADPPDTAVATDTLSEDAVDPDGVAPDAVADPDVLAPDAVADPDALADDATPLPDTTPLQGTLCAPCAGDADCADALVCVVTELDDALCLPRCSSGCAEDALTGSCVSLPDSFGDARSVCEPTTAGCGGCGNGQPDPYEQCDDGGLVDDDGCSADCAEESSCPALTADCDGDEANGCETPIDTLTDCGACGAPCALDHADASCDDGDCRVATCDAGYDDCDLAANNGCEARLDTLTDCGACGAACVLAHAASACADAQCALTACDNGFDDCDADPANGCETELGTPSDCQSCGDACVYAHASATCGASGCAMAGCVPGYASCDADPANGCETATTTLAHCGACNTPCALPHATASCATGACVVAACDTGYADCDGAAANGCETPTNTLTDCGACGAACAVDHGAGSCTTGACLVASCDAGHDDCDGVPGNGCETPLDTLTACGACGAVCAAPHGTTSCTTGSCALTACGDGYADCDGGLANGCETPLGTATDCAACGDACQFDHAGAVCSAGACALGTCAAGFGDCNTSTADGCETSLKTLADCGGCGTPCTYLHGTATCATGTCAPVACETGHADCDANMLNGCESDLTDPLSCGSCGNVCGEGEDCLAGQCVITPTLQVAMGSSHACAVLQDGRVVCWGTPNSALGIGSAVPSVPGTPVQVIGLTDAVAVAAANDSSCALRTGGKVSCWGTHTGTGVSSTVPVEVPGLSNVRSLVGGNQNFCALSTTGAVSCWGTNTKGNLGSGTTASSATPTLVLNLSDATGIAAGYGATCAVRVGGTVVCWGDKEVTRTAADSTTPVAISGLTGVAQVIVSYEVACARKTSGQVACWGYGIMGNGQAQADTFPPVLVAGIPDAVELAAGRRHVCARRASGALSCWGEGAYGAIGSGDSASALLPVSPRRWGNLALPAVSGVFAGSYAEATCITLTNGAVWCTGDGDIIGDGRKASRSYFYPLVHRAPTSVEDGVCHDGEDNDGDGASDCSDSDCSLSAGSVVGVVAITGAIDGSNSSNHVKVCAASGAPDGRDRRYAWTAPSAGQYTFTLRTTTSTRWGNANPNPSFEGTLILQDGDCFGAQLACVGQSSTYNSGAALSRTFAANERVYIVVDSGTSLATRWTSFQVDITKN
ncbi:MAG: hypothetical protein CVU56_26305 [Deltaproteobacteria bacterium HGW-Deltaproteobacteria-14]|jgi:hypothetical protein|nr:MAG: hypothetical protein CVU56_26305 [Deltaproteobacteria bacterium HGW-Deltaproteobacteria-14]